MPRLASLQAQPSGPPQKDQNIAVNSNGRIEESAGAEDTESINSSSTIDIGPEGLLRQAEDYRERIIELGGRPTRQIAEYSRELEEKRILLMPRTASSRRTADEEYYRHYCSMEASFFNDELKAWQSFMKWFRRKWAQQNEAAGGSLPPPPPVFEIDPLDLHTQYLGFMLLCRKEDENEASHLRSWNFHSYEGFLEHIAAVEKLVAKMREERGPEVEDRFPERLGYCAKVLANWGLGDPAGFQEQLGIVATELTDMQAQRARRQQSSDASPFMFIQQAADSPEPKPQLNRTNLKRKHEGGAIEPNAIARSPSAGSYDGTAPVPKRIKRGGAKVELDRTITTERTPKKPRGKNNKKTEDVEAEHKPLETKHNAAEAKTELKSKQKRRGRLPKQSQPTPAMDTAAQGKTKSGQKRRAGPRNQAQLTAQEPSASTLADGRHKANKKAAVTKVQKNPKAASDSGLRRSARIAELARKNIT